MNIKIINVKEYTCEPVNVKILSAHE